MFAFWKGDKYYLYSPRYIEWELVENEINLTPTVLRLGRTWYKRPKLGYSYEITGTTHQKSFYEYLRRDWDKVWLGVFVRLYLSVPAGVGNITAGWYNFYIITGDIIVENLKVAEPHTFDPQNIEFAIKFQKIYPHKRPLWLAVAKFHTGEVGIASLDIGNVDGIFTSDWNVRYYLTEPTAGTLFRSKNYEGIQYLYNPEDWETLPLAFYTTFNTTPTWSENELNIGLTAPVRYEN